MKPLRLLPVGGVPDGLLSFLQSALRQSLHVPCEIVPTVLDPSATFHAERRQYHSSQILAGMQKFAQGESWRVLGVTDVDLYIPILTFVFGEAQTDGQCALVSTRRLQQEFYGLAPDPVILQQRVLKEAIHEIGHTCDLTHCDNYQCAMAASYAVEWIDIKDAALCKECREKIEFSLG
ncbi:MAG TPA: archaemetzincin family Zn-dependent metalloprotease [Terriglobales bacterium]|nr:archaemetzincin family Zn-dependent metalloprotease [Terriglobales bacterium]